MSLLFDANGEYVQHPAGSGQAPGSQTWMAWIYPTSFGVADNSVLGSFGGTKDWFFNLTTGGALDGYIQRTDWGNRLRAVSSTTPVTTGSWHFVAFASNLSGVAADQELYHGSLTVNVAEVSGYSEQLLGSGTHDSSGSNLRAGRFSAPADLSHRTAWIAIYNSKLTERQIRAQAYDLSKPLFSGCRIFVHYGFHGTGTQTDWSGNKYNGTVFSTTTVASHVPIGGFYNSGKGFFVPPPTPTRYAQAIAQQMPVKSDYELTAKVRFV